MTVRAKIAAAFKSLEKRGYFARAAWQCCQSCGCAALPEGTENYVFYHRQDVDCLRETGGCYLAWGGDGQAIADAMRAEGLVVEWDGSPTTRILVRG